MKRYLLQLIVGILILSFVVRLFVNFEKISKIKFEWIFFTLSVLAYSILNILLALRLKILLNSIDVKISFGDTLKAHISGMLAGDVTPGRSGYILTAKFVDKILKCGVEKPIVAIVAPQGIEFLLKGVGAFLAVLYILNVIDPYVAMAILLMVVLGVTISLLFFTSEKISIKIFEMLPLFKSKLNITDIKIESENILKCIPLIIVIYILGWISVGFQWFFISNALNLHLNFVQVFLLHPLVTALSFVPITPAGVGIMEGGGVVIFKVLGVNETYAFSFIVLARISNMIGDLPGLLFLGSFKFSRQPS